MKGIAFLLSVVALTGALLYMAPASGHADDGASPIFGIKIPPGYRDWKLISVAHEEGNLNDLRALLGNDVAIKAYREGRLPFPDGTIIARLAWSYVPSEENDKVFGRAQSFVAGSPINLQLSVKDSRKIRLDGRLGVRSIQRRSIPVIQAHPAAGAHQRSPDRPCVEPSKSDVTRASHPRRKRDSTIDWGRAPAIAGAR